MEHPSRAPLCILSEAEFEQKISTIDQQLAQCRQTGEFEGVHAARLYYECFQRPDSRGAVVVVHGLSEFTEKYHEFAWYLLNQGYDVFLYDQRCHGRSCRLTDQQDLIHVDSFSDYREDLHRFVCHVVRKHTDLPLYLYAHSMGGATALLYLAEHPDVFQKAILSAPMLQPITGSVSPLVARLGLSAYLMLFDGKKKFWDSREFDPDYPFSRSNDQSPARFARNMQLRRANPCYRTTPLSIRWIHQSVKLYPTLMRKKFLNKLRTPMLMLSAQQDTVVSSAAQEAFAQRCPVCQRVVLPNATHGMLCGTVETITEHMQHVLDYFC